MKAAPAKWVDIGALESVPVRGARVVKSAIGCIAIFRTAGEEAFAIEDRCSLRGRGLVRFRERPTEDPAIARRAIEAS